MASTDIDGSPILIVAAPRAELIADLLRDRGRLRPLDEKEQALAKSLKDTFGINL